MSAYAYAIRYGPELVYDPSWACVADVVGSFHGGYFTTPAGQVTGVLLRAVVGTDEWVEQ